MGNMDGWQIALLAVAVYVSVTSLVRMMRRRRDELVDKFRAEYEAERKKKRKQQALEEQQRPSKAA